MNHLHEDWRTHEDVQETDPHLEGEKTDHGSARVFDKGIRAQVLDQSTHQKHEQTDRCGADRMGYSELACPERPCLEPLTETFDVGSNLVTECRDCTTDTQKECPEETQSEQPTDNALIPKLDWSDA
jgi:hypothetical protein